MNNLILYIAGLTLILWLYLRRRGRKQAAYRRELQEVLEAGLAEPPSLHPVVDPGRCFGSGACVRACPEEALGIVAGKAVLINGSACIGHGACLPACPVEAISLVFGTEKRGIDIPNISPDFETNVPGIFIAGELGGMGLVRKAAEQGRQAVDAIQRKARHKGAKHDLDLLIVGCGPAGLSAGLAAIQHQLNYRVIEQEDSLGGAVYHYPRNKITMTAPVQLPIVGKVKFNEVSKETLLEFWLSVVKKTGLKISYRERLTGIERHGNGFTVQTNVGSYTAASVLLAMGRRGTPRKLDVPGEEASKVVYRLVDPEQYRGQKVLVVGGGDSALEAAIALSEQPDTGVILSYRSEAFSRVKGRNRSLLEEAQKAGRIEVMLSSKVKTIDVRSVTIEFNGATRQHDNDIVIVCAGGELPTPLLKRIGIEFQTKFGTQ
jgi:thioredoxin reductase/NAD-dependent dihydropyrimidine dehydrogenase PreA subunit